MKHAGPPGKKHAVLWTLLALASLIITLATLATGGAGTVLVGVVAVLAAGFAVRATRYNASVYPGLRELWERSFMCGRCGEVFAA